MSGQWATAWSMAHTGGAMIAPKTTGKTVRTTVDVNLTGEKIRVRLSNRMGAKDIRIGSASARAGSRNARPVLFSGQRALTLSPGQDVMSDPLELAVNAGDGITVSLYYPNGGDKAISGNLTAVGQHSVKGDYTGDIPFAMEKFKPPLLTRMSGTEVTELMTGFAGIDVLTRENVCIVAAFGDSLTGMGLWTDPLRERLYQAYPGHTALLNMGINGNRLLRDTNVKMFKQMYGLAGLKRADWDIFKLSGVSAVILEIGLNDIFLPGSAGMFSPKIDEVCTFSELTAGYSGLISRIHQSGIRVIGCTLTPCGGVKTFNANTESLRRSINRWMLENKEYDGVVDFASRIADPDDISRMLPAFDCGDHVHPNKPGGKHLADLIDLKALVQ